jgi:hypothetical protein
MKREFDTPQSTDRRKYLMMQIIKNSQAKGHNQLSIQTITTKTTTTFLFCFSVSATFAPKKKRRETITVLLKDCAAIGRREDHVVVNRAAPERKKVMRSHCRQICLHRQMSTIASNPSPFFSYYPQRIHLY